MGYTVGEVAKVAGVTVRTLHHYEQIGLLAPAGRSSSGYRVYDDVDLERLQQVLFYRELGFSLDQIAAVLASPKDALEHLAYQHSLVLERIQHLQGLVAAIERAMEEKKMGTPPTPWKRGLQMISDERIELELRGTLDETTFEHLGSAHKGKVRDSYTTGDVRTIVTTDRVSAFDRLLGTMPFKGQALNEIANFWFEATSDIIPNHLLEIPDPNVVRVRECEPVALEFVVRAYITGVTRTSLWFNYEQGQRDMAGNRLPEGLRKNERLAAPILTPTTKFEPHDRNIRGADAVGEGLVERDLFDRISEISFQLFERGTDIAASRGLILVDTKYEFGTVDGELVLMDEVHTPDSSRYWYADTYEELFRKGKDQRALDKEPLREWFVQQGFRGEGVAPPLADEVRLATASRYISLAEEITQRPFEATELTARDRVAALFAQ
jgi:phosphoribosylaminoimidazole-succinocarboxamide synthase